MPEFCLKSAQNAPSMKILRLVTHKCHVFEKFLPLCDPSEPPPCLPHPTSSTYLSIPISIQLSFYIYTYTTYFYTTFPFISYPNLRIPNIQVSNTNKNRHLTNRNDTDIIWSGGAIMGTLEKVLNAECAGELFSRDSIKKQYREMLREIHPDICKDARAKEATEKLIELYERGIKGEWYTGATIIKNSKTGKRYRIKPIKEYNIGIGKMYLTKRYIIIEIEREAYKGRGNKEMESISGLGSLPVIKYEDWGNGITVIERGEEIPLREFWNNYKCRIPAKVCAWIVTRLLSYACGLKMLGLVHCNITIDSVFLDIEGHGVKLCGGWCYCVKVGHKMIGTTQEVYRVMSPISKRDKKARFSTDIESIKALALRLMGCNSRICSTSVPIPIMEFLRSCSSENAIEELEKWEKALKDSWGARKFVVVDPKMGEIH